MNNLVLTPEMEKKLAALALRAEEHLRYDSASTHRALKLVVDDPEMQKWLQAQRDAGHAPSTQFPRWDGGNKGWGRGKYE
jgi:hypothetical protein